MKHKKRLSVDHEDNNTIDDSSSQLYDSFFGILTENEVFQLPQSEYQIHDFRGAFLFDNSQDATSQPNDSYSHILS